MFFVPFSVLGVIYRYAFDKSYRISFKRKHFDKEGGMKQKRISITYNR